MSTYQGTAHREGEWWVIGVPGVGATQVKRIDQIEHMARDMIAAMEDVDYESVSVDIDVRLPEELDRMRAESERLIREAEDAAMRARSYRVEVMRAMHNRRLSTRDIGRLTGVSHQRVGQIVAKVDPETGKLRVTRSGGNRHRSTSGTTGQ